MPEDKDQPQFTSNPPNDTSTPAPTEPAPYNSEVLAIEAEPTTTSPNTPVSPVATVPSDTVASVEMQPSTTPFSPNESSKPKRSRKLLIIGLVSLLVVGLLTGTGAAAYTMWYQKPEKVLADAVVKLIQARAVVYEGDLLYQSKDSGMKLEIRFDGKADRANNTETVDLKLTVDKRTFPLKASFIQTENSVFYFKIDNLQSTIEYSEDEGFKLPAAAIKLIKKIDGKWVKITLEDIKEWGQEVADTQKCTGDVFRNTKNDDAAYKEIADAYSLHPFVTSKGDIETKDGNLNFEVDTNEAELKKFVGELNDTSIFKKLQKCDKDSYTLNPDDYETEEEDAKDETASVRVSISQWTHELRQISSTFKSDGSSGDFNLKPQFVEKVDMNEPKDAMSLDELEKLVDQLQAELVDAFGSSAYDSVNETNALMVVKKIETYNADKGRYPTLAQLKTATGVAKLSTQLAELVTSARPSAATPTLIQYEPCVSQGVVDGGYVSYYDTTSNTVEKQSVGMCSELST